MRSIKLVLILLVLGAAGGGWVYIQNLQKNLITLSANNAILENAVQINEATIKQIQNDYAAAQAELIKINREYAEIRRQNNLLASKLADKDIGFLAAEKPESIERAINRGTYNAGRCFEILSGSPLTERELNAKSGESFNRECPWLWPGPANSNAARGLQ